MGRTPIIHSTSIIERLREIQLREGRAGSAEDYHRRIALEIVPFYEAPTHEAGLVRFAGTKPNIRVAQRCARCPLSATNEKGCMCYSGSRPIQYLKLPPGWID